MRSRFAAIIIILAIVSLVGSIFAMSYMMSSGDHANCLAGIPGSPNCTDVTSPLEFAATHINAFENASLGIVAPIIFFLVVVSFLFIERGTGEENIGVSFSPAVIAEHVAISARKWLHWLSIREERDHYLFCAAIA